MTTHRAGKTPEGCVFLIEGAHAGPGTLEITPWRNIVIIERSRVHHDIRIGHNIEDAMAFFN